MIAYSSDVDHDQHVALVRGELEGDSHRRSSASIRTASPATSFGSTSCIAKSLVERSLEAIAKENRGVFLYLHHTGRGFGIDQPDENWEAPQNSRSRARPARPRTRPPAPHPARIRHRRPNPDRSWPARHPRPNQPPQKSRRPRRLRHHHRRPGPPKHRQRKAHSSTPMIFRTTTNRLRHVRLGTSRTFLALSS